MPVSARVSLQNVSKSFGATQAIKDVCLDVLPGELLVLLGPSGCGKTTTLRIIAGFERPDQGAVFIDGLDVSGVPPHRRQLAMVFQSHALFPHMNVYENVAFGLRVRRRSEREIREKVEWALNLVGLGQKGKNYPNQLSGGEQQRVGFVRALVVEPKVLLADEPFGSLDRKLRKEIQVEFRDLQKRLGLTVVFVTHDQEEALVLADRVAIMDQGRVVQVGTPREVYDAPANRFVAEFVGEVNAMSGRVIGVEHGVVVVITPAGLVRAPNRANVSVGVDVAVMVRPERTALFEEPPPAQWNSMTCTVREVSFLGEKMRYKVEVKGGSSMVVDRQNAESTRMIPIGKTAWVCWSADDTLVFPG